MKRANLPAVLRAAVALTAGLAPIVCAPGVARADIFSYASERREIKSCVLTIGGANQENAVPYVFNVLEQRDDYRPSGWTFINPLSGTTITTDIYSRWKARDNADPALGANTPFIVGAPLTKGMGAYWEVNLDTISTQDLDQFDIVFLGYTNGGVSFSTDEREKLRHFLDAGGTLWLEDEGGLKITGGQFLTDLAFTNIGTNGASTLLTLHHPLVNFPYEISPIEAYGIEDTNTFAHTLHAASDPTLYGGIGFASPYVLVPLIANPTGKAALVSAGDYGAGHLVVSSAGIAEGISSHAGGYKAAGEPGNSGAIGGTNYNTARPVDLKFAYNMIAWTTSVPTAAGNPRRTGSVNEDIGSRLAPKWAWPIDVAQTNPGSGAVMYKGVVFYVDGGNVLHAFDADPITDLDLDGNSDDGKPDFINGTPYDEIWRVDLTKASLGIGATTRVSTPTVMSVLDTGNGPNSTYGRPHDIVAVTAANGTTAFFEAFPSSGGRLTASTNLTGKVVAAAGYDLGTVGTYNINNIHNHKVPMPGPAFSEGVAFTIYPVPSAGDPTNVWRFFPADPVTGANVFAEAGAGAGAAPVPQAGNVGFPAVIGPITVGYVRDGPTGALEKMVYTTTVPVAGSTRGVIQAAWFSTKGEPLTSVGGNRFTLLSNRAKVPWFVPTTGGKKYTLSAGVDLRPVLHQSPTGPDIPWDPTHVNGFDVSYEGGVGNRNTYVTLFGVVIGANTTLMADYTLDWADAPLWDGQVGGTNPGQAPQPSELLYITNRFFQMFDPRAPIVGQDPILTNGGVTLTGSDLVLFNQGDVPPFDRIVALHDQFNLAPNPAQPGIAQGAHVAWMFGPNAPGNTQENEFFSSVGLEPRLITASSGEAAVETGTGWVVGDLELVGAPVVAKGIAYQVGYVQMQSAVSGGGKGYKATVLLALKANPDMTVHYNQPLPDPTIPFQLAQPDLIQSTAANPRWITFNQRVNFTVDQDAGSIHFFDCRSTNGELLNTALPLYMEENGQVSTTPIVDPNTGLGPLDNLAWWMLIPQNGAFSTAPPLPAELADSDPASGLSIVGNTLFYGTRGGHLITVDVSTIPINGGQATYYSDFSKLRVHSQAVLADPANGGVRSQEIIHAPLGTGNIVVVGSPYGLAALDNQVTTISDNNRLIEVDAAGNATWALTATQSLAVAGGQQTATSIPLSRPSVVHRYSLNQNIVADTGNNRILLVNKSGTTVWETHKLSDGMGFLAPGDPNALSQPSDVQTYSETVPSLTLVSPVTGISYTPTVNGTVTLVHYLIADAGNNRLLELLDGYDANGNVVVMTPNPVGGANVTLQRQLTFVSTGAGEQNRQPRYRTIEQYIGPDYTGATAGNAATFLLSAVDNARERPTNKYTVLIGDVPGVHVGPGSSLVIRWRFPDATQHPIMKPDLPLADGDDAFIIYSLTDKSGNTYRLQHPTWFRHIESADGYPHFLVADDNGCYEIRLESAGTMGLITNANPPVRAIVRWAITSQDYFALTGRPLRAVSVQRLTQADYDVKSGAFYPHYLVTNSYSGPDKVTNFGMAGVTNGFVHGEVFEIRSLDYFTNGYGAAAALYTGAGSNLNSAITHLIPNETIPANGPIQRVIGTVNGTQTYILEQPTSAERPY